MLKSEGDKLSKVVVCPPLKEYFNITNLSAHNFVDIPDKEKALEQHSFLRYVMESYGCEVIEIPELKDHPNSVFVTDPLISTPGGYIKLRMGLPSRRGEETWISEFFNDLGEPSVGSINPPGTVEGGDVILADKVAFIGRSGRTNEEGIKQLSYYLKAMEYHIRLAIIPPPYLHIGGAMSMLDPETILHCEGLFPDKYFEGYRTIKVHGEQFISGNVICLGTKEVIVDAANTVVASILDKEGFTIHAIDLSEFIKGSGGPTCMIQSVERF